MKITLRKRNFRFSSLGGVATTHSLKRDWNFSHVGPALMCKCVGSVWSDFTFRLEKAWKSKVHSLKSKFIVDLVLCLNRFFSFPRCLPLPFTWLKPLWRPKVMGHFRGNPSMINIHVWTLKRLGSWYICCFLEDLHRKTETGPPNGHQDFWKEGKSPVTNYRYKTATGQLVREDTWLADEAPCGQDDVDGRTQQRL